MRCNGSTKGCFLRNRENNFPLFHENNHIPALLHAWERSFNLFRESIRPFAAFRKRRSRCHFLSIGRPGPLLRQVQRSVLDEKAEKFSIGPAIPVLYISALVMHNMCPKGLIILVKQELNCKGCTVWRIHNSLCLLLWLARRFSGVLSFSWKFGIIYSPGYCHVCCQLMCLFDPIWFTYRRLPRQLSRLTNPVLF